MVCHRHERWEGPTRHVLVPGGARLPSEQPQLAAWRILLRSRRGALGPVVGACPACGMPLTSSGPHAESVPWTLELGGGPVEVGVVIRRGGIAIPEDDVTRLLERAHRRRVPWTQLPSLALTLAVLGAIALAVGLALTVLSTFFAWLFRGV